RSPHRHGAAVGGGCRRGSAACLSGGLCRTDDAVQRNGGRSLPHHPDRDLPVSNRARTSALLRLSAGRSRLLGLQVGFRYRSSEFRPGAVALGIEGLFETEAALGG